jgi:hypothetical protein
MMVPRGVKVMKLLITSSTVSSYFHHMPIAGSNPAKTVGFFDAKKTSACLPSEGK